MAGNQLIKVTMKKLLLAMTMTFVAVAPLGANATPWTVTPQCRTTDRVIPKRIRFTRGRTTAVIKDTVRLCTSHEYTLRARAGQTMSVHLATGSRTSFTIQGQQGVLEGADGVNDWSGELPDSGAYTIAIGTDATANYTLEVTIR
jgi:hypothetical protein